MKTFTITAIAPRKRFIRNLVHAPTKDLAIEGFLKKNGIFLTILKVQEETVN